MDRNKLENNTLCTRRRKKGSNCSVAFIRAHTVVFALFSIFIIAALALGFGVYFMQKNTLANTINRTNNHAIYVNDDRQSTQGAEGSLNGENVSDTEALAELEYEQGNKNSGQEYYLFASQVPELFQGTFLMGGCEIVSLTALLNSMGYGVSMTTIANRYVEYGGDGVSAYSGDPFSCGMCFPPVIVQAGNRFLYEQDSGYELIALQKAGFDELLERVERGIPVLVWTTMGMEQPDHTGSYIRGYQWYSNEHCVVLYAADDDYVSIMDPLVGFVDRDRKDFQLLYYECGQMSVSISA